MQLQQKKFWRKKPAKASRLSEQIRMNERDVDEKRWLYFLFKYIDILHK